MSSTMSVTNLPFPVAPKLPPKLPSIMNKAPLRPPVFPKAAPRIANKLTSNSNHSEVSNKQTTEETAAISSPETSTHPNSQEQIQLQSSSNSNHLDVSNEQTTEETHIQTTEETQRQTMLTRIQFEDLVSLQQYTMNETQSDDCNLSLPDSVQRKYAKKRVKLLTKLQQQWGVKDDTDYTEMFNAVMDALRPLEDTVKNPSVLVDLFAAKLPVTANLIAAQAIEQFILCFPKQYRKHLRETRIGKFKLVYPSTYNFFEEANEYGEKSFYFTLSVPKGEEKTIIRVQSLAGYEEKPHIITTVAIDKPERISADVSFASLPGFGMGEAILISNFTPDSLQHYQNVEFVFYDHSKFRLETPKDEFVSIYVADHVADIVPTNTDSETSEEESDSETSEDNSDVICLD